MRLLLIVFIFISVGLLPSQFANELDDFLHIQPKPIKSNILQLSEPEGHIPKNSAKNHTKMDASDSHIPGKNDTDAHIPTRELYRAYLEKVDSTNVNTSYVDFLLNFANITVHYLPNVTVTNDSIKIQNTVYDRELKNRTFKVDYDKNEFSKDGKQFRYASGEMHYFRSFPSSWRRKMRAMRAAGFSVISTYIEWSTHNPQDDDRYIWTGLQDAEKFVRMAMAESLLVILRPGPYICAERNGGGFPHWLTAKYPQIYIRSMDPNYLKENRKWFAELMPRFIPYLYENGGPIILVQVENEYGVYYGCDRNYRYWMRDETEKYVGGKAVLFTNDIKDDKYMKCGKIEGVLATTDFNVASNSSIDKYLQTLRKYQPKGPCVDSEFYAGWPTYWFDKSRRSISIDEMAESLGYQYQRGCSVNTYLFIGGTNFGFTSSTGFDSGGYESVMSSYDYDAVLSEAGDLTAKYHRVRDVNRQYFPLPDIDVPENEPKMVLPPVELRPRTTLFSKRARFMLGSDVRQSNRPLLFENFTQDAGFLLYETKLNDSIGNPSTIKIPILHDRAIIYLNNTRIGTLTRRKKTNSMQIDTGKGNFLQILVEHQGRQSYEVLNETKGIVGDVLLNDKRIEQWNITSFPFANFTGLNHLLGALHDAKQDDDTLKRLNQTSEQLSNEPIIFDGTFDIENDTIHDTFVDTRGWGKGFIYINGFNLGRHWPLAGPQLALYLPKDLLKKENNSIVLVEMEQAPKNHSISFLNSTLYTHVISNEV